MFNIVAVLTRNLLQISMFSQIINTGYNHEQRINFNLPRYATCVVSILIQLPEGDFHTTSSSDD